MTMPGGLLNPFWVAAGWAVATVLLALAGGSLAKKWRQRHLGEEPSIQPWFGGIVALVILWQLDIRTEQGLLLHLLGSGLFALMFGPARALVGLLVVLIAVTANGHGDWSMLGLNLVSNAALPIAFMSVWRWAARKWLPYHLFVYLFANCFFGAALTLFLSGVSVMLLVLAGSAVPLDAERFIDGWLPPVLLLCFSEAWLSGMILTLLVIYRPEWVVSFDRRQTLRKT